MKICIVQPEHCPWLGYFDKIAACNAVVLLDTVQFKKRYFENRNRIRTRAGWTWISVPVRTKGKYLQQIKDVEIDLDRDWRNDHVKTIQSNYARSQYFSAYSDFFKETYVDRDWRLLSELNIHLIRWGSRQFGLESTFMKASDLPVEGRSSELLVNICRKMSASVYLSGISGKDYLDETKFSDCGIKVEYQEFHHPIYRQVYSGFEPCMAFIDLLLNEGPNSRKVLLDGANRLDKVFT